MKKTLCLLIALLLLCSLAACTVLPAPEEGDIAENEPAASAATAVPASEEDAASTEAPAADVPAAPVALPQPQEGMTRLMNEAADLDGDGTAEYVLVDSDDEQKVNVTVVSGQQVMTTALDYPYAPRLYALHAFWNDGTQQIVISGDTGSDDYVTEIFGYDQGTIKSVRLDGYPVELHDDGTLVISTPIDVFGTYGGTCVYTLAPDMSVERSTDFTIETYDGFETDRLITVKKDGLSGLNAAGEAVSLPVGTTLLLKSTDALSYALCSTSLGEDVKISIERMPDEWEWFIDSVPESEWFGELLYAG